MIPKLYKVQQTFCNDLVENVREEVLNKLADSGVTVNKGASIAIAVGSRGIANIPLIVKTVADWVRGQGGSPFIVPAMGSHGNGIAEEQKKILEGLGITEEYTGTPIHASMEVVELPNGNMSNRVYMDKNAYCADGTIVINRIKIHGDFFGETESGLLKMCTIGLGKHKQALEIHSYDISRLRELIVGSARQILKHGNIMLGIGVIENAYHQTMEVCAIRPEQFETEEIRMLARYKQIMPKLPLDNIDVLIVDEIGKEISGAGMETKIVGRLRSGAAEPDKPKIRYIVTTDLTDASHGNACGVGIADFISRRLFNKIDLAATNENIVTCRCIEQGRIPIIAEDDRQAVEFAIRALGKLPETGPRIVRIKNTLRMEKLYATANILDEISHNPWVTGIGSKGYDIFRDNDRNLIPFDEIDN